MTYDPCPIADQIRAAREAGAAPGTVFVPRTPTPIARARMAISRAFNVRGSRIHRDPSMTKNAIKLRARRAQERLLRGLGIGESTGRTDATHT